MDIHDPRARWPDGTLVDNKFPAGSFRWSLIAEWWFWMDDTVLVMSEIMSFTTQSIYKAIKDVRRKTGWIPPVKAGQEGRQKKC